MRVLAALLAALVLGLAAAQVVPTTLAVKPPYYFTASYQGATATVWIYTDADWPAVLKALDKRPTLFGTYRAQYNTILLKLSTWRTSLVHEMSHVMDTQFAVPRMHEQVPECRQSPYRFNFATRWPAGYFEQNPDRLSYHCERTEVLARYREWVYQSLCPGKLRPLGIATELECESPPDLRGLTVEHAVRAASR